MKIITYDIEYVDYKAKPEEYYEIQGSRVISKSDGTTDREEGCWEVYLTADVCPGCNGTGKHVHRGIDGNGLSEEDLSDPQFMEDYFGGVYDVTCETCNGLRVVFTPTGSSSKQRTPPWRMLSRAGKSSPGGKLGYRNMNGGTGPSAPAPPPHTTTGGSNDC